jgi:hypothetical protein
MPKNLPRHCLTQSWKDVTILKHNKMKDQVTLSSLSQMSACDLLTTMKHVISAR